MGQKHVYLTKNNLYRRTSKFEICSLIDGLHLSKLGLTKSYILLQSLSSPPSLNSTVFWIGVCLCLFAPIYPVQMGEQDIVSSHGLVQWNATETVVRIRKESSHNNIYCLLYTVFDIILYPPSFLLEIRVIIKFLKILGTP